jgi:hypothetical protein
MASAAIPELFDFLNTLQGEAVNARQIAAFPKPRRKQPPIREAFLFEQVKGAVYGVECFRSFYTGEPRDPSRINKKIQRLPTGP